MNSVHLELYPGYKYIQYEAGRRVNTEHEIRRDNFHKSLTKIDAWFALSFHTSVRISSNYQLRVVQDRFAKYLFQLPATYK